MGKKAPTPEMPAGADISLFSLPVSIAALGVVAFVAAANGATGLASAAAMAFALMSAARAWGRLGLSKLDIGLSCGQRAPVPGEPLTVRIEVSNRKILPVWIRIELAHSDALTPEDSDGVRGETGILPFERITGSWRFRSTRRGVHVLGPAEISAGDVFGLNTRGKTIPWSREIVVFPRPAAIRPFDIPFRDNFGIHPSKGIIEDPAWYEGTREYQGSRPAKNIHWKARRPPFRTAGKDIRPHTSHQKVFLILDGSGFLETRDGEGLESALEILAALARRFSETGASFGLATDLRVKNFSPSIPLGRGPEHMGRALELMARCEAEREQALAPLLGRAGASGAGFLIVSHSPTRETTNRFLDLPSARRDRAFFLFRGRTGAEAPLGYPFLFFDDILEEDE
jgi:uncharacterized protein (DUF58 family)